MKISYNNIPIEVIMLTPAGSRLYGNSTPDSDYDYRGVYIIEPSLKLGLQSLPETIDSQEFFNELSDKFDLDLKDTQDCVIYELNKFSKLCIDNNPNILDILCANKDDFIYLNDKGKRIIESKHLFLSKKTKYTFSGYAFSELNKLKSHNKNITKYPDTSIIFNFLTELYNNEKIDFNWITTYFSGDVALKIADKDKSIDKSSLLKIEDFINSIKTDVENINEYILPKLIDYIKIYNIKHRLLEKERTIIHFLNKRASFRRFSTNVIACYTDGHGIFSKEGNLKCNDSEIIGDFVCLLKIDIDSYNKDRKSLISMYKHKILRNPKRLALEDKFAYDTKNASHLIRILQKSKEILTTKDYNPQLKGELLKKVKETREGKYTYQEIIDYAEESKQELENIYNTSTLREKADFYSINKLIIELNNYTIS